MNYYSIYWNRWICSLCKGVKSMKAHRKDPSHLTESYFISAEGNASQVDIEYRDPNKQTDKRG